MCFCMHSTQKQKYEYEYYICPHNLKNQKIAAKLQKKNDIGKFYCFFQGNRIKIDVVALKKHKHYIESGIADDSWRVFITPSM